MGGQNDDVPATLTGRNDDDVVECYRTLADEGPLSFSTVRDRLDLTDRGAERVLSELSDEGVVDSHHCLSDARKVMYDVTESGSMEDLK